MSTMHKDIPTETLAGQLRILKEKTSWSWERISNEFHRVMGEAGPSLTTLFRYATGCVKRPNVMAERYVQEAIHKISGELVEKQLRESQEWQEHVDRELLATDFSIRQLAENARDIIYRYRLVPTRGFEYISPAVTEITGFTPREHYEDPDLDLKTLHPDDRQKLEKYYQGKGVFNEPVTLRHIHKDGRLVWTERVSVPIYDKRGELVAIEGISRDANQRKPR